MIGYPLPADFLIGTANSAFQSEGALDRDGKSPSNMEYFCLKYAGKKVDGTDGSNSVLLRSTLNPDADMAIRNGCFFYDQYEAYIDDMKKTGQNTFRMSLAWPRIIPTGTGAVNPKGIDFYNRVINKLLACGITPFVDLWHWDMPECLMEQGGFENPAFPAWYEAYAKVCFEAFGDRVKLWSTFNELHIAVDRGYIAGRFPPYHKDMRLGQLAGHHAILAHFRAVRLYKSMNLGGKIGAVNCISCVSPATVTREEDQFAAEVQQARNFDWWARPMLEGRYPEILLEKIPVIRDNMPPHFQEDLDKWFVPMDFIGLNYYNPARTGYDPERPLLSKSVVGFYAQPGAVVPVYPAGLFDAVQYVAERYGNIEMYISENGHNTINIHDEEKECDDEERVSYIREHLRMVSRAVRAGYNLKGYYWWNDADSNEGATGYRLRFGLTWVDHETGRRRWKKSRYYFSEICKMHRVD